MSSMDPAEKNSDNDDEVVDRTNYGDEGNVYRKRQRSFRGLEDYGFIDDCAIFPGVFDHCCRIAGASIQVMYPLPPPSLSHTHLALIYIQNRNE